MKKRLRLALSAVVVALLLTSLTGMSFASNDPNVYSYEGKEFRSIPVEGSTPLTATADETASFIKDQNMADEREKIKGILNTNDFGGVYVNQSGDNVYLLKKNSLALEKKIKTINPEAIVSYVRFSEKELDNIEAKLREQTNLGIQFTVKKITNNTIEVYISQEEYDKNSKEILRNLDSTAVEFIIGNFELIDQSSTIYPGGKVDKKVNSTLYRPCTVAFNASTSSHSKVAVTAGHCDNGAYFKLSDGTSTIGSMANATTSGIDAGYIKLASGVNVSHYLNGSTRTIGTYDWNGAGHTVGNLTSLFAPTFGSVGSSGWIINSSYSGLGLTDAVLVGDVGSQDGDSGGLWYRNIVKNGKSYAVIEGVHKGVIVDINTGKTLYAVYSKFEHVYTGLGLNGVYVDSNY